MQERIIIFTIRSSKQRQQTLTEHEFPSSLLQSLGKIITTSSYSISRSAIDYVEERLDKEGLCFFLAKSHGIEGFIPFKIKNYIFLFFSFGYHFYIN